MIGAITMCSRSRQPAARKRETVSAPPSIRMRRKPRAASAARIAAGAIRPPSAASGTISTSAGSCVGAPSPVITSRRIPSAASARALDGNRAAGIDHDPRGAWTLDPPDGQLRIVRHGRPDPDDHGIDQCPQAVQVGEAGLPIDVMRMAGGRSRCGRRSTGRLSDHDQIVDPTGPQRSEDVLPGRGQGTFRIAERCRNSSPGGIGARADRSWEWGTVFGCGIGRAVDRPAVGGVHPSCCTTCFRSRFRRAMIFGWTVRAKCVSSKCKNWRE